jgi:DNA primase
MEIEVDSREVKITHPDKVLFPEDGITKGEPVDYFRQVAEPVRAAVPGPSPDDAAVHRRHR